MGPSSNTNAILRSFVVNADTDRTSARPVSFKRFVITARGRLSPQSPYWWYPDTAGEPKGWGFGVRGPKTGCGANPFGRPPAHCFGANSRADMGGLGIDAAG